METRRWPTELRLSKDRRTLRIAFDDGSAFDLAAEYLRVASPSAEVQGHSPSERKTAPLPVPMSYTLRTAPVPRFSSAGAQTASRVRSSLAFTVTTLDT